MTLTDNLQAYYKLDGNSNDSTANGYNGTDTSIDYDNAYGKINQGARINANSDKISLGDPANLKFSGAHTLAMWVNFSGVNRASLDQLFFKGSDGVDFGCITAYFSGTNTIVYGINADRTKNSRVECSSTFTIDSNWHLFIFEYTGSAMYIYLDNNQIATTNTSISIDTTGNWYLGNTNSTRAVSKYMDMAGMWNRALTSDERTALWNGGAGIQYPFSTTSIKSINGLAYASVKSYNGLAKASIKNINGLS